MHFHLRLKAGKGGFILWAQVTSGGWGREKGPPRRIFPKELLDEKVRNSLETGRGKGAIEGDEGFTEGHSLTVLRMA